MVNLLRGIWESQGKKSNEEEKKSSCWWDLNPRHLDLPWADVKPNLLPQQPLFLSWSRWRHKNLNEWFFSCHETWSWRQLRQVETFIYHVKIFETPELRSTWSIFLTEPTLFSPPSTFPQTSNKPVLMNDREISLAFNIPLLWSLWFGFLGNQHRSF